MHIISRNLAFPLIGVVALASVLHLSNHWGYQYPGNHYLPQNTPLLLVNLLLINLGLHLVFETHHPLTSITREVSIFFSIMLLTGFLTTSVQYTPYDPIDKILIQWENALGVDLLQWMQWGRSCGPFYKVLQISYDSLVYQMAFLPLIMILLGIKRPEFMDVLYRYYSLFLWSLLIGFSFYYFFPTTGPASHLSSSLFISSQYDTGIKFREIQAYIPPTTLDGGMIAMPSFHAIWAILCTYLTHPVKILFYPLLLNNTLLIIACVLLGWHYPIDILGSFVIILIILTTQPRYF